MLHAPGQLYLTRACRQQRQKPWLLPLAPQQHAGMAFMFFLRNKRVYTYFNVLQDACRAVQEP